jgi:hypothetical protein
MDAQTNYLLLGIAIFYYWLTSFQLIFTLKMKTTLLVLQQRLIRPKSIFFFFFPLIKGGFELCSINKVLNLTFYCG